MLSPMVRLMAQTVLLTLGRLPKALDIARSFQAAGWRVIIAEPFGWHLTGLSRAVAKSFTVPAPNDGAEAYLSALLDLITAESVSLIVPISEETMHVAALHERLPDGVTLLCPSQDKLLALHDKWTFIEVAKSVGLPVPETALLGTPEAEELVASGPVVVKDRLGASGAHVQFVEQGGALPTRPGAIVQRRLNGREVSSLTMIRPRDGAVRHGSGSVRERSDGGETVSYRPVIRDGTVSTVFERLEDNDPDHQAVLDYIRTFSQVFSGTSFCGFDFIIGEDGRAVAFECNPRANSGLHFWQTADIAGALLDPDFRPRFKPKRLLQQLYPTLTLWWGSLGTWPRYRQIAKALFSATDVSWSWRDPLPFILQTPATWPILKQAIFEGRPLGKAAIVDIGWFDHGMVEIDVPSEQVSTLHDA